MTERVPYSHEQAEADRLGRKEACEQIENRPITAEQAMTIAVSALDLMVRQLSMRHMPEYGIYDPSYAWATKAKAYYEEALAAEKVRLSWVPDEEEPDAEGS